MRASVQSVILLGLILSSFVFTGAAYKAPPKAGDKKSYESLIYSVKGPDLYRAHCAACHGPEGTGGGPVAPTLTTKPPDLTMLATSNGGKFPEMRVRRIISGDEPSLLAHGSREMPVWGPIFHQIENDQDFGNVRLQNMIKYLESIQRK